MITNFLVFEIPYSSQVILKLADFGSDDVKRSAGQVYIFAKGIADQADLIIKGTDVSDPQRFGAIESNYQELGQYIERLKNDLGIF